jgi:hypothetical protein
MAHAVMRCLDINRRRCEMKQQQAAIPAAQQGATRAKAARPARKGNGQSEMAAGTGREELIRQKAYALFEARQCESGHELEDWLQAEAQVSQDSSGQQRV